MKRLALLLLPLLLLGSNDARKQTVVGGVVPGLSSGIGNYATLDYLQHLPSFQALPADLIKIYVSADANPGCNPVVTGPNAGTCAPAGLDTNPGTVELPILTATRCEALSAFGHVQCIFDSADAWNAAADHTGDAGWARGAAALCSDLDAPCLVWSGSDRTGGDPAVFDCEAMFGAVAFANSGLFTDAAASGGYWAVENIRLENCPTSGGSGNGDIFRQTGSGDFVALNVQLPHHQGHSNQYFTSHDPTQGGGRNQAEMIAINPFCHIIDWVQAANEGSECFRSAGQFDQIIIGGELSSSDDTALSGNQQDLVQATGGAAPAPISNTTIIGTSLRNLDAASLGMDVMGVSFGKIVDTERSNVGLLLNVFQGFRGATGDLPIFGSYAGGGSPVSPTSMNVYLYKNSIQGGTVGFQMVSNNVAPIATIKGACNAWDGQTTAVAFFAFDGTADDCAAMTVDLRNNVADEDTPTNAYALEPTAHETSAALEAASTSQGCGVAPTSSSGFAWQFDVTNDPTPFGTDVNVAICEDTSCANICTTDGEWIFPNNGKIPAFVAGQEIRGFRFPGSPATHVGR